MGGGRATGGIRPEVAMKPPAVTARLVPIRPLGHGLRGETTLALDEVRDSLVVVKTIAPWGQPPTPSQIERLERAVAALGDRASVEREDGAVRFVRPFVEGRSLAEHLDGLGGAALLTSTRGWSASDAGAAPGDSPPRPTDALPDRETVLELTRVLAAAAELVDTQLHVNGRAHGNLKPGNVLVLAGDEVCLVDAGLPRPELGDGAPARMPQNLLGHPFYAAPEQLLGVTDARSDVYCLAALLYECVTLQPPHVGPSPEVTCRHLLDGSPADARQLNHAVPRSLAGVLGVALEREPARRPATAGELAGALHDTIEREAGGSRSSSSGARRRPRVGVLRILSTVALVLAGLVMLALAGRGWALQREVAAAEAELLAVRAQLDPLDVLVHQRRRERLQRIAHELYPPHPALLPEIESWMNDAAAEREAGYPLPSELVADVRSRAISASSLEYETVGSPQARRAWEAAFEHLRTEPAYAGVELAPILGLLPLGLDCEREPHLLEFAHVLSGEPARRREDGRLELTPETGVVLVLVPGGPMVLGGPAVGKSDADEHDWQWGKEVDLPAYFIAKHEMTREQWHRVMGTLPPATLVSPAEKERPRLPVTNVSWEEATECLRRCGLVLPTDAQWELAARGGAHTPWWTGESALRLTDRGANLADLSVRRAGLDSPVIEWLDDGHPGLVTPGWSRPNPYGLHEVHGNVREWTRDWYSEQNTRSSRGGSCLSLPQYARAASLHYRAPTGRSMLLGLRPALELPR